MSASGYDQFDDTAFHPQSSFDFDDFGDDRIHNLSTDAHHCRLGKRDPGTMLSSRCARPNLLCSTSPLTAPLAAHTAESLRTRHLETAMIQMM